MKKFYKIKKEKNSYFLEGNEITSETIKLADPTHDSTFKSLFSSLDSNETNWKKRTISLLKSLIIEGEIKDIMPITNVLIQPDNEEKSKGDHISLLQPDLSFQLKMEKNDEYDLIELINIEKKLGYPFYFLDRLANYGLLLKNKNRKDEKKKMENATQLKL